MSSAKSPPNRFVFPLEILSCLGTELHQHSTKGIVFFVDSAVDLMAFSQEVANDNAQYIAQCMQKKLVEKAKTEDLSAERTFRFIIVQPYIFVEKTS